MNRRRGWVLNLDAEFELIDPEHRPSPRLAMTVRDRAAAVVAAMGAASGERPWVVDPDGFPREGRAPDRGDAWCPTPRALARLAAAGLEPPSAPSWSVLRSVNHRAFGLALAPADDFPGARFCRRVDEVFAAFADATHAPWLLKRALGFSGRMRKVVVPERLDAAQRTWIAASMRGHGDGLVVEPLVERLADFALHGRVDDDGAVVLGRPVACRYTTDGAWSDARPAAGGELDLAEARALVASAERVGHALHVAQYHGPFGIDAFRWTRGGRAARFRALVEVNARHTMSWWSGAVPDA